MITLVTIATGDMQRVWNLASKTWTPYCEKHGYQLKCYSWLPLPKLHPSWNKVQVVLNELEHNNDPVWWIDADMTVARPDIALESLVETDAPISFSTDWNGICAGMFRAQPCEFAVTLLKTALFCGDVAEDDDFGKGLGCKWEQNAFKLLIQSFPAISDQVGRLRFDTVNDQPQAKPQEGVVYHFGGRTNDVRCRLISALHKV